MDSDSDFDDHSKRRTRARQITYAESDDSEVVRLFIIKFIVNYCEI